MRFLKLAVLSIISVMLISCVGGSGEASNGSSNPLPVPAPSNSSTGVNIGNISTIPLGNNASNTFVIVNNNFANTLLLKSGTYTVYNSSGTGINKDIRSPDSPVNTSLCNSIQGNGSCSIMVSVPANTAQDGQYLINLNFLNIKTGDTYNASQIISYSANIPTSLSGVTFSEINNTIYNQPGGSASYSVPFVLTQAVSNLSALSEYNNPAFAPTISCQGTAPYPAGTLCTLYIKIANTGTNSIISGNIIITSNASSSAQIKSKAISIKGTTGYLFNVPVTVVQNNTGNLITSAINTIISPANGSSPQTITLLNNGAAAISGISITAGNPLTIQSNLCSSLAANASCTFAVNANQTSNGQSSVVVNYTTGGNSKVLTFNVAYIALSTSPGLIMSTSGTFINTPINTSRTLNINVLNNSTATLSNISFTPQSNFPTAITYSTGSCVNGTQSLSPNQQCTLVLQYSPSGVTGSSSFIIREAAQYIAQNGSSGSYTASTLTINYSAITGNAFVYITPSNVAFAIRADGSDLQTQTFSLVNASSLATTVTSESNANPPVTAYISTGGTCSFPESLGAAGSGTESCTVITRFGPTTATINTTSQMMANYIANPTSGESAFALSALSFTASPAALISVTNIAVTGQSSGNGNSATPYQFTNSPTTQLKFTVTYSNSGTQNATNFNVAVNNLPVGYFVIESQSTCGRESSVSTLATSTSCNVVFAAMSTTQLYNPYALAGALNVNIPGYSYTDTSTGLNTNSAPLFSPTYTTNTIFVNLNTFGSATQTVPPNWTTATSGGNNTMTFTGTNGLRITIPNTQQLTIFTFPGGTTCVIAGGNCTISITNPTGFPLGTVYFQYVVSPSGSSAGSPGIINTGSFTYTQ